MRPHTLTTFVAVLLSVNLYAQNPIVWAQRSKKVASDREASANYGNAVSIYDDIAAVGAYRESKDENGLNPLTAAGAVYLLRKINGHWSQFQKITAPQQDRDIYDGFGRSISLEKDWLVVGAPDETTDELGQNPEGAAGAIYIFKRQPGGLWQFFQKITPLDRSSYDNFGISVSIQNERVIVGAYLKNVTAPAYLSNVGAAYIFELNAQNRFQQAAKFLAPDADAQDLFGFSVDIYENYAVVGAKGQNEGIQPGNAQQNAGAAYLYHRDSLGNWSYIQKIVASGRASGDEFGFGVSITSGFVAVGAKFEDHLDANGNMLINPGAVYIYKKGQGNNWGQVQKIIASDGVNSQAFGSVLDFSGQYLVVGAELDGVGLGGSPPSSNAGAAYIYENQGSSGWGEVQKLVAQDREAGDFFGRGVSIYGRDICIGALFEDHDTSGVQQLSEAGAAYFFQSPCVNTFHKLKVSICSGDSIYLAGGWQNSSGTYVDSYASVLGCDSIIETELDVQYLDTTVTVTGNTLYANTAMQTYQWINCEDGSPVPGATNASFSPQESGSYAVVVTIGNCTAVSACYPIVLTSLRTQVEKEKFEIYPNPASSYVSIKLPETVKEASVEVFDALGKKMDRFMISRSDLSGYDITYLNSGLYLFCVKIEGKVYLRQIQIIK